MKQISIYLLSTFLLLTGMLLHSCDDKTNDWPVEGEVDRLFAPLMFEDSKIEPTAIEIKHTLVLNAAEYIFEFSKDQFETIEQEVVILADTLTPFSPSSTPVRIEYRTLFEGLDGTSDYTVRMHAVNEDGSLKSNYVSFDFTTPAEQIFRTHIPLANSFTMVWEPTDDVTHVVLYEEEGDSVEKEGKVLETHTLSAAEKAAGRVEFTDLSLGTYYVVRIFNEDILRGRYTVKTLGVAGSSIYKVKDDDNAGSISDKLAALVANGAKDITVEFTPGKTYAIGGNINIPSGVNDIYFIGSQDNEGNNTTLSGGLFYITTEANNIIFEYLTITSGGGFTMQANGATLNNISFESCNVSQLNSVVILNNGATANGIYLNNCWISNTGGWGMLNVGAGNAINEISVTNCTLTEINTRFADVRVKCEIYFSKITCCNINETMSHLWYFENNNLATVRIEHCIISGPNNGVALHSTNGKYSTMVSYASCYKTNDLVEDSRPLEDITEVDLDIYELFVDPANRDFRIKPGNGFAGTGVAGDPRWFE